MYIVHSTVDFSTHNHHRSEYENGSCIALNPAPTCVVEPSEITQDRQEVLRCASWHGSYSNASHQNHSHIQAIHEKVRTNGVTFSYSWQSLLPTTAPGINGAIVGSMGLVSAILEGARP